MFETVRRQPQSRGFGGFGIASRGTLQLVFENIIDSLFDVGQVSLGARLLDALGQERKADSAGVLPDVAAIPAP